MEKNSFQESLVLLIPGEFWQSSISKGKCLQFWFISTFNLIFPIANGSSSSMKISTGSLLLVVNFSIGEFKILSFHQDLHNLTVPKNATNFDSSGYPNSTSLDTGLIFPTEVAVEKFLFFRVYLIHAIDYFLSVGVLIVQDCLKKST